MPSSAKTGKGIAHGTLALALATPDGLVLIIWEGIHGITSSASSVMNERVSMMPGRPWALQDRGR